MQYGAFIKYVDQRLSQRPDQFSSAYAIQNPIKGANSSNDMEKMTDLLLPSLKLIVDVDSIDPQTFYVLRSSSKFQQSKYR